MSGQPVIRAFFDDPTNTVSYLVADATTKKAANIDPVFDCEHNSGEVDTRSVEAMRSAPRPDCAAAPAARSPRRHRPPARPRAPPCRPSGWLQRPTWRCRGAAWSTSADGRAAALRALRSEQPPSGRSGAIHGYVRSGLGRRSSLRDSPRSNPCPARIPPSPRTTPGTRRRPDEGFYRARPVLSGSPSGRAESAPDAAGLSAAALPARPGSRSPPRRTSGRASVPPRRMGCA